jgi:hypothetical protein
MQQLVVQVHTGRPSRSADPANGLSQADRLTGLHESLAQVSIARDVAVAVIDFDELSMGPGGAGAGDLPAGGRKDGRAMMGDQINPLMPARSTRDRVCSQSESA